MTGDGGDSSGETVDVLVVGPGGGVAGAYTAARNGLSVALVEATGQFGGTAHGRREFGAAPQELAKIATPLHYASKVLFVRRGLLADGRGRLLAVAVSVVVSGAMLYAQNAESPSSAEIPAAAPAGQESVLPSAPFIASPAQAESLVASAPVAAPVFQFAIPAGVAPEEGLQVNTIRAARAISVMFPEITNIGGFRQDPLQWHPSGLAIDVMIPNHGTEKGIELGNQVAGLALANAKRWGVIHVIWRQGFYPGVGAPSWTADYGSETANHFDHVHIATNGGGYPKGRETYVM
jgi:hypothetical protein